MSDREKYIEVLSKTVKTVKELNEDDPIKISLQCVEDIIELLKEQEAIEPVKIPWLHSDGSVSEKYRCGSCDLSIFPSYKFCPFCGQAVKWE